MSDSSASTNYREKYKSALLEQDRIEKQMNMQIDALKKTLFQLGAAAAGMDQTLDSTVKRLRETMRGGTGAQVLERMECVHNAVAEFEQNRGLYSSKAAKSMSQLIEQYSSLQIPKTIKTSLKEYSNGLRQRLNNYYQYPLALDDLAKLQQLALTAASQPQAGLLTRLRGGKTLMPAQEAASIDPPTEDNKSQTQTDRGTGQTAHISLDGADEGSYEQVSQRISTTLANLVEKIEPNEAIKHRVAIVRHRIERGMDWYVLAVTLEDIRDILFLRYLQADEDFSEYLNQVRTELGTIREALVGAQTDGEEQQKAANTFSDQVNTGMERIRSSISESTHIDELKGDVSEHLTFISSALKDFKERPKASLSTQLSSLMAQIQAIETDSENTKAALEEQRHKATHDTLTGLPNREAYSERIFHELQRFERYKRPLVLCICDIDHFKKINDGYGHAAGDKVLKLIANVISKRLRNVDFMARFGGEEFVILMPETDSKQAYGVLDKVRAAVAKTPFRFKDDPVTITISFGIAEFNEKDTSASVFERADKALYTAKEQGRNCCVIATEHEQETRANVPNSTSA